MTGTELVERIVARKHVYQLKCDLCGKHLGYVSEYDMNENYVMCLLCVPEGVIRK